MPSSRSRGWAIPGSRRSAPNWSRSSGKPTSTPTPTSTGTCRPTTTRRGRAGTKCWASLGPASSATPRASTFLSDTVATCTDRVKSQDATNRNAVDDWKKTQLYKSLESLETALKAWDDLLAAEAFPSRDKLARAADDCETAFENFGRKHKLVYLDAKAAPYVRFQLLAAMRVLAETVATQFASRAGRASFSAMYQRLTSLPGGGRHACRHDGPSSPEDAVQGSRQGLVRGVGVAAGRPQGLAEIGAQVGSTSRPPRRRPAGGRCGPEEFDALAKLKPKVDLAASFKSWKKAYERPGAGTSR